MIGSVKIRSFGLLLGVLLKIIPATSLKCYICANECIENPAPNVTCGENIAKHFGGEDAINDPMACLKTIMDGEVIRSCNPSSKAGCFTDVIGGLHITTCACFTDFCNSARQRSVSMYSLTILAIVMSFVHRWLQ